MIIESIFHLQTILFAFHFTDLTQSAIGKLKYSSYILKALHASRKLTLYHHTSNDNILRHRKALPTTPKHNHPLTFSPLIIYLFHNHCSNFSKLIFLLNFFQCNAPLVTAFQTITEKIIKLLIRLSNFKSIL